MDQQGRGHGIPDRLHVVLDGDDEAGGVLLVRAWASGVHQGGGIGQEGARGQHPAELLLDGRYLLMCRLIQGLDRGDFAGDPSPELVHGFNDVPLVILGQVSFSEDGESVLREEIAFMGGSWHGIRCVGRHQ